MLRSKAREEILAVTNSWNWQAPVLPEEVDAILSALESAGLRFEDEAREDDLYWSKFRHETVRQLLVGTVSGAASNPNLTHFDKNKCIADSIRCTDALIEELRK